MTEPKLITLNLTLKELQQIDKFVEINDDTLSVLTKIKDAYPRPKMHLKNEGEFSIVSYDDEIYYRLQLPTSVSWYVKVEDNYERVGLHFENELESQWLVNDVKYQNDEEPYCPDEPEYYDEIECDIKEGTAPPEPTSTVFRQKLFDGIKSVFYDPDYERTHWKMKVDMAVDEVMTHFYDILPEPEEYIGDYGPSQGYVDGWNHYHKIIKEKLE
jgi:hypothetical protein